MRSLNDDLFAFKFAVDHTSEEFYLVRPDASFAYINDAAARSLGYTRDEMYGMGLAGIEPGFTYEMFQVHFDLLKQGDSPPPFEVMHRARDGSLRLKEIRAVRLRIGDEEYTCGFGRDVTERREAEVARERMEVQVRQLQHLESLGMLAGGIGHDFNGLLTVILGNLSLMARQLPAGGPVEGLLEQAEKATLRARELTGQLLTLSRGQAPVRQAVRLPDLVRDAISTASAGSNVRCELAVPRDLWPAEVDPAQMAQVVQNLVMNGRDAMPEGGVLRITGANRDLDAGAVDELEGRFVELMFADTGQGVPADEIGHLFDPYFSSRRGGGGLRLATTWSIVKRHGGHVVVESQEREGTRFRVFLPAALSQEEPGAIPPSAHGFGRVLLVDDEPAIQVLLRSMLVLLGYEPETSPTGEEAVERFAVAAREGKPFRLAILDVTLPGGMGGTELLERLRALDPDLPAVVTSGYTRSPLLRNFRNYGFQGALEKPYRVADVARALERALRR